MKIKIEFEIDLREEKTRNCKCGCKEKVKAGFAKKKQRYTCKKCGRRFVGIKTKKKYSRQAKERAIRLYLKGLSLRTAAGEVGASHTLLQYWIKQKAKKLRKKTPAYAPVIEIDEIYYFVGKKKKIRWLWLAVCRKTKRILAFQTGTRSQATLKKLVYRIQPIKTLHYYTDQHVSFKGLLSKEKYTASKLFTCTVEGINSMIRHFLARFRRRTKCYTKSEIMLEATLDLFINRYNQARQAA